MKKVNSICKKIAVVSAIVCAISLMALYVLNRNVKYVAEPITSFYLHNNAGEIIATAKVEGVWETAPEGEPDRFSDMAKYQWVHWSYNDIDLMHEYASELGCGFWAKQPK